jgi:hypothetical protein
VFNIGRPLQKYHSGQLEKIYGQQHLIWEHPKLAAGLEWQVTECAGEL